MTENALKFETLLIHGGLEPGPAGSTNVPIVQSSAFAYDTAEDLEDVFRGRKVGQVYTRLNNPTTEALEKRLSVLEGGGATIVTASGMAAIATAVLTILRCGDEILSSSSLFGGTFSLFRDTLSNYGITALWTAARYRIPVVFVIQKNGTYGALRGFADLLDTGETPGLDVPGIDFVQIAQGYGVEARAVTTGEEFVLVIKSAHDRPRPVLIEVATAHLQFLELT